MKFASDIVKTEVPQLLDMGFPAINTLNESGVFGTPATSFRRLTDASHWSTQDHVFGEAKSVGMSVANSDHDYSYRTDFEIWRKNQQFDCQNILMSQPPSDSTPIGTNTTNVKTSHLDLTPIGIKTPNPKTLTRPTDLSKRNGKRTYQRNRSQTHHCQTHHRVNLIRPMTANTENKRVRDAIKRKRVGNSRNRTRQTHRLATLIFTTKVIQ